jgi:hypothetical protein
MRRSSRDRAGDHAPWLPDHPSTAAAGGLALGTIPASLLQPTTHLQLPLSLPAWSSDASVVLAMVDASVDRVPGADPVPLGCGTVPLSLAGPDKEAPVRTVPLTRCGHPRLDHVYVPFHGSKCGRWYMRAISVLGHSDELVPALHCVLRRQRSKLLFHRFPRLLRSPFDAMDVLDNPQV